MSLRAWIKSGSYNVPRYLVAGMRCKSQEAHFPGSQSWGRTRQLIRQTDVNLCKDRNRKPVKRLLHWSQNGNEARKLQSHLVVSWPTNAFGLQQMPKSTLLIRMEHWNLVLLPRDREGDPWGSLAAVPDWEIGKSECQAVMVWIRV